MSIDIPLTVTEWGGLHTPYQQYIAMSRYSRWLPEENRRETWKETVLRYCNYMQEKFDPEKKLDWCKIFFKIFNCEVMPSMRCLMTAGPALDNDNIAGFNCAALGIKDVSDFAEVMYILMNGTGVGFSVEEKYIKNLPEVGNHITPSWFKKSNNTAAPDVTTFNWTGERFIIDVGDSKVGWAHALNYCMALQYSKLMWEHNYPITFDYSKVRPKGARLKTFGGRASGPEPLKALFKYIGETFDGIRQEGVKRRLTSIEIHDIVCKIADIVVVGGVRRSALISLSDLDDPLMRDAKSGNWYDKETGYPHRALANNSAAYNKKPPMTQYIEEFDALIKSRSGERGIYNREAITRNCIVKGRYGLVGLENPILTNPCSEIVLRHKQFCNLTEVVVRPNDSLETLTEKVKVASQLGTMQAHLDDYMFISDEWKKNAVNDRLLGVSLTGLLDNHVFADACRAGPNNAYYNKATNWLQDIRTYAKLENISTTDQLFKGSNYSAAITCVKPSGTVSQLVDSASGCHPRYSAHYLRTVRADEKDPLNAFMKSQGVYSELCVRDSHTNVFYFPVSSPKGALTDNDITPIQHLEFWKLLQEVWCDHKPSCTITVKEDEWVGVATWCWENWNVLSGVSFLPHSDHVYQQTPYTRQTKKELEAFKDLHGYNDMKFDWSTFKEEEDTTTSSQELACTGGTCEVA